MKAFVSPYFIAPSPDQLLRRGSFADSPDVVQRGWEILFGLEDAQCAIAFTSDLPPRESILTVHDSGYLDYLENAWSIWSQLPDANREIFPNISPNRHMSNFNQNPIALAGWYIADCAAPIGEYTWRKALGSVAAALAAAGSILGGEDAVYALCRPSGHHASRDMAMGVCYLNNTAIAAVELRKKFDRVAILDIDVHHGNGTQQIFYQRRDILTISIHGDPTNFYPYYTGFTTEIGAGDGEGYNFNFPLPAKTDEAAYLTALEIALQKLSDFQPDALVVATGFDTFKDDPVGYFSLESKSYYEIGRIVRSLNLPTLFVQEGGYFVAALRENVRQLIAGFELLASPFEEERKN